MKTMSIIHEVIKTWVKSEKGTISYPYRPMFNILWKNCEPSQRYGPDKSSIKKEEERWKNNDKNIVFPLGETNYSQPDIHTDFGSQPFDIAYQVTILLSVYTREALSSDVFNKAW